MANFEGLVVDAWIGIRADCDISYCINTEEDADFMFSDGQRRFDFAIETEALRKLVEVGGQALSEMDARRSNDDQTAVPAVVPEAAERPAMSPNPSEVASLALDLPDDSRMRGVAEPAT